MERRKADVVIIGGGASGMAAAAEIGMDSAGLDVLVIEKMPEPGRKIRATGSGRCNITNTGAEGFGRIMEFFRRMGLVTRVYENGLVYPYSESAADVAELLRARAESLGASFACGEEVVRITADESGRPDCAFLTESIYRDKGGEHHVVTSARYVILACGGKAGPSYGTTGDGYRLAREFGHSIVTPVPALTGIECEEWGAEASPRAIVLGGTRSRARVSLCKDSSSVFEETGELQFTKYGLSGICVFNMTRCMRLDRAAGEVLGDFRVYADLFPDGDVRAYIEDKRQGDFSGEETGRALCTLLKEPLAGYVIRRAAAAAGRDADEFYRTPLSALTADEISAVAESVHSLSFRPSGVRGWKEAQVSMGGVSLDEIDEASSESKKIPGLYITGELADRDFQCGGYNLSNAWITGLAAADDICRKS